MVHDSIWFRRNEVRRLTVAVRIVPLQLNEYTIEEAQPALGLIDLRARPARPRPITMLGVGEAGVLVLTGRILMIRTIIWLERH